jgi:DNA-binding response OmpR family regulator
METPIQLFLAEDDPLMSRMYTRAFTLAGFKLTVASDGEVAIEMLKAMKEMPSVAVLDVMMPKKSGFDVLQAMQADPELKKIPVVMLTNLAGDEDAKKGINMGAKEYLIKSQYSPKQIVEKIEQVIKG